MRKAKIERKTFETDILVELNIDGTGQSEIETGIGFLDHMLTLFAFHGLFDLKLKCKGDTYIDDHHTVEDIGIALGQAFNSAIGDRKGIKRYSDISLPMDESLCSVALDISNRPYLVFNADFLQQKLGDMDTQNVKEFFRAFVKEAGITLHINLVYGENDHHKVESIFKGISRVLKEGAEIISDNISSSKGVL